MTTQRRALCWACVVVGLVLFVLDLAGTHAIGRWGGPLGAGLLAAAAGQLWRDRRIRP